MNINEYEFISYLFNDGIIQTCFKDNIVSFIDTESGEKVVTIYTGMKNFLEEIAALNIPDNTSLCNIPTAAAAALCFIK